MIKMTLFLILMPQPHANQGNWMADWKDKRISFLSGLFGAFKEDILTDTQLKPGDNGPCIPAHRVLLVNSILPSNFY